MFVGRFNNDFCGKKLFCSIKFSIKDNLILRDDIVLF